MSISVIIVNYNGLRHLKKCLRSLKNQWPFEVIIVDNNSTDGSVEWIRAHHPSTKIIVSKKNVGFAQGNNLGIVKAKGEWVLFLNNDTKLPKGFFKELKEPLNKANGDVGMFSLRILFSANKKIDTLGLRLNKIGLSKDIKNEKELSQLTGPCGAGAIYRKKTLESIKDKYGYYDRRFFMYSEDADLAWRAQKAGWRAQYLPIEIFHVHGGSTTENETIQDPFLFFSLRNRILMFLKNNKNPFYHVCFFALQGIIFGKYLLKGKGRLAFHAIIHGYTKIILPPEKIISFYA